MAATQYVLWGFKPTVLPFPVRLWDGALRENNAWMRTYTSEGWTCGIYPKGATPEGLRLVAKAKTATTAREDSCDATA